MTRLSAPRPFALLARFVVASLAAALVLAACSGDEDPPPFTASPSASAASEAPTGTPSAEPSATGTATPTTTPDPIEVLDTLWLVEAATGTIATLAETSGSVFGEGFEVGGAVVEYRTRGGVHRANLQGNALDTVEPRCTSTADGVLIDGVAYAGIRCGLISPRGGSMAYTTWEAGFVYGYGVLDLETHERRLIRGDLVSCGGCDWHWGAAWAASERYLVISESGGEGRIFLADLETGTDREIGQGNQREDEPRWSPTDDTLALSGGDGTMLLHAPTREAREIEAPWPARWDPSGRYLYAPPWVWQPSTASGPREVTVYDTTTAEAGVLPGFPPGVHFWTDTAAVAGLESGGYTAALEYAPGCRGVRITSPLAPLTTSGGRCVEGALGASISPDGRRVAMVVNAGEQVRAITTPGGSPATMARYRLMILDVATGVETEAPQELLGHFGSFGGESPPPAITWNEAGTHFLVRWPAAYGI